MKLVLSLFLTICLLFGCMLVLHQTHAFSESLLTVGVRLSFLELACPILSVLGYASPIFSVKTMLSTSDRSDFPLTVILAQAAQGLAGAAYGIHINDGPFFFSSLLGLCFQLCWIQAWYICLRRSRDIALPSVMFFLILITIFAVAVLLQVVLLSTALVGYISCLSALLLCVSPLANLGIIVRSRNSASIPIVMSVVMLLGNAGWTSYGLLKEDVFVYLPSVFGFFMTSFQLIVTAWCAGMLPYDLAFLQAIFPTPYRTVSPVTALELGRRESGLGHPRDD